MPKHYTMADQESLHISDLHSTALSSPGAGAPPMQNRMEQEIKSRRRSRTKRKTGRPQSPTTAATGPPPQTLKSLVDIPSDSTQLNEFYMNALRARLDPLPNPAPPPEGVQAPLSDEGGKESPKVTKQKKSRGGTEDFKSDGDRGRAENCVNSPPLPPSLPTPPVPDVPQPPPTGVSLQGRDPNDPLLLVDNEDIIEGGGGGRGMQYINTHRRDQHPALLVSKRSSSNDLIFQQQKGTGAFIHLKEGHDRSGKKAQGGGGVVGEEEVDAGETGEKSSTDFVLAVHYIFKTVTMILHGLIAGVSLWDSSVSYTLSTEQDQATLLLHYHRFPLYLHAMYLFIITSIVIVLMDRLDVAKVTVECLKGCLRGSHFALGAALLLMFISLITTTVSAFLDSRIALFTNQPTLWTNLLIPNNSSRQTTAVISGSTQYALNTNGVSNYVTGWLIVNILRTITLTLSWIILGWVQNADRLKDYIMAMSN